MTKTINSPSDLHGKAERSLFIERAAVDTDARTVTLAFAGETPCERWYGNEILDCKAASIRLARLTTAGPLLVGHDSDDQVGVIESVEIGSDKVCRAVVRFGRSARAEEILQDVLDGIRPHVSVGYMVHEAMLESEKDGVATYRVTDWEPYEVSIVSMPADFKTAGVGRSAAIELKQKPEQEKPVMEEKDLKAATDKAATEARAAEQKRVADIVSLGDKFAARGGHELAAALIKDGNATAADFHERMLAKIDASQAEATRREGSAPLRVQVVERHNPDSLRAWKRHGAKAEELAHRAGQWAKAVIAGDEQAQRWCKDHFDQRVMVSTAGAAGGYTVPDEMESAIIDLRAEYGAVRRLAQIYPMTSGTVTIPKWGAGTSAYFVGEQTATSESDASLGQVTLVAKEVSALTRISNTLIEDSVIDFAAFVANEQGYAFAVKEDACFIDGDGSSTYGGITGLKALLEVSGMAGIYTAASNSDTPAEIIAAELSGVMAKLPSYARMGAVWLASPSFDEMIFGRLMAAAGGNTTATLAGQIVAAYLGKPRVVCEPCYSNLTTDLTGKAMLFYGNFRQGVAMGERRGMSIQVLRERYAEYRQIGVLGTERIDIVNHGVGDTSSAGPIIALIGG